MLLHPYPTSAGNPYFLFSPFRLDHAAAVEASVNADLLTMAATAQGIIAFGICNNEESLLNRLHSMTEVAGQRDREGKNETSPAAAAVKKQYCLRGLRFCCWRERAQRWVHRVVSNLECVHGTMELVPCCLCILDASVYDVLAMQVTPRLSRVPRSMTPCAMSWHENLLRPIFETGGTPCHTFMRVRKLHSETIPPYTLPRRRRN